MPIEFFETSDGLVHVSESFVSPTVYLDHWAIRLFSDNKTLQDRLVNALLSKQGTLLLSTFSFSEFTFIDDIQHCINAETFIERLLPNIYLTDFALNKLHEQELKEQNNLKRFWPSADLPQLKLFAERAQDTTLGFTMKGFIELAHDNRQYLSEVTKEVVSMVKAGLEITRRDPAYVAKARKFIPSDKSTRTHIIMAELLRTYNLDINASITENDVMDMTHAAMPINCCDYVLLDGPWCERAEKMRARIKKSKIEMPIAKCYSARKNGISTFLSDLESF